MVRSLVAVLFIPLALSWARAADVPADPIARWSFDTMPEGKLAGELKLASAGPVSPRFPDFGDSNGALLLSRQAYIRMSDRADDDSFDFDNGDVITLEAWVNPNSLGDNAYIIGKGRTESGGAKSRNQNWALRLRKHKGQACVNFLFHSRSDGEDDGDWHRWTSSRGFTVGSGWHHVAVRYEFGDPKSIAGFVDGEKISGNWDMGGETKRPPVVDEDEVWIGSAMGGHRGNSFDGAIDELAVYRHAIPDGELKKRYRYVPREISQPEIPEGKVVVEMFGPYATFNKFPNETVDPTLLWQQDAMGMDRLPNAYDQWGVRDDWAQAGRGTMLVRSWAQIDLEPGEYQLLVRSRGLSRLIVDGKKVVDTPAQRNRGGAHHVVDPIPEVPVPGMRPHYMNDHEKIVTFRSDGKRHTFRFDVNVGSTKFCIKVGETCVAIARKGEMFHLLAPGESLPLTDEGWESYANSFGATIDHVDQINRRLALSKGQDYWDQRHAYARQSLISKEPHPSIDQVIEARIEKHNRAVAAAPRLDKAQQFYLDRVQPILEQHCARCHGEKRQGGLTISAREDLLTGGESGDPAIVPGHADASYLFELVSAEGDDYRMPPEGPGLSEEQLSDIQAWITDGAVMPDRPKAKVQLAADIDDYAFLRRAFIDTVGVFPSLQEIDEYFAIDAALRREQLVERLLDDPRWADNWVGYWQDSFAENPNLLKPTLNNTGPFRYWIHDSLTDNKPLDQFATDLIMMRGSPWTGGAAGFGIASQNDAPMAAKAHVIGNAFLGVEMKCARCHDAPYHDWKQSDLFQMAAMLKREPLKLPSSSTVPAAFFEKQTRKSLITATLKPGTTIELGWPFDDVTTPLREDLLVDAEDPREQLALHVTASRRFAEVMANRIWKRLMGSGVVEPVHDWHGNPPSDEVLLRTLANELILCGYDQKQFVRKILLSKAYQRAGISQPEHRYFAGPTRRRMSAEQIVDSSLRAVGQQMRTEMLTLDLEGTFPPDRFINFGRPRAAWQFTTLANERDRPSLALPRAQAVTDVLQAFGWRNSRPEPVSEREEDPNLIQPGALANGTFGVWLTRLSDRSELTKLMLERQPVEQLVDRMFLRMLTREPAAEERERFVQLLQVGYEKRIVPRAQWGPAEKPQRFRNVSWSNHLNTEANKIKIEMQELARRGDPPTRFLRPSWRERAEDAVWALLNNPEMVLIP